MSPLNSTARALVMGFPRVSGDEPVVDQHLDTTQRFSPRERG